MLITVLFEKRGARLVAAMAAALLISSALWLYFMGPAFAASDYDGDTFINDDCEPLDPAVHPNATDHPDLAFEDVNCDGIDGDKDGAYFVMPSGNDNNVGTPNAPFQTIQKAIDMARSINPDPNTPNDIYVATGSYNQRLSLPTDADGIRIYGGYAAGTWTRSTTPATTVNGQPEAMFLDGATDVVVQLVTLNGTRGSGLSAYGVRAINNSEIALIRAQATAGPGGNGTSGGGGTQPSKATNGAPGQSGPTDCNIAGDGGSANQFGIGTNGGAGGKGGEETNDGENGAPGSPGDGIFGGAPGAGGVDIAGDSHGPNDGMHGGPGGPGGPGAAGSNGGGGGNDLSNAGATWIGRDGSDGTPGGFGYGGGGGGGGAGRGDFFNWGAGAGGGQGGEGGAGGTRGTRGQWGGGSFGLYLQNSQAAIVNGSTLQSSNGGAGGAGGNGGAGGEGGDGGPGGVARTNCGISLGNGGAGGNGGPGGEGGDGGGGSGGPSAALMRLGTSAATDHNSTLTPGTGGPGGTATNAGVSGQSGAKLPAASSGSTDFDGDGLTDSADTCVEIPRGATDNNGDGCPDRPAALTDTDGDGVPDNADACPNVAANTEDGCPPDTTAPTVETWLPKGKNVSPRAKPTVTFSEAMDEATVEASAAGKPVNFVLKKGTTVIPAVVTYTGDGTTFKAVLDPDRNLKRGAKYTATVTPGAEDEAGNALVPKTWSFTVKR